MNSRKLLFQTFAVVLLGLLTFASPCLGAEILWKKNLQVGLPDTPIVQADITPDPGMELAFTTTRGKLAVCNLAGEIIWVCESSYGVFCNSPTVADLFPGDGPELLAVNRKGELTCFSSAGEEIWQYDFPSGMDWCQTTIVAGDLNHDGNTQVLCGDTEGHFVCLNRLGTEEWKFQVPGGFHCPPAVADLDEDGFLETVITSGDGQLIALSHEGLPKWTAELGCDNISGPVIADIDRDNAYEILVGGEDGHLRCFSAQGQPLWKSPLADKGTDSTISVGDLTGDGILEIVCLDLGGNCFCFDAKGKRLWDSNFGMRSRRAASLADFNNDGNIEILVSGYFSSFHLLSAEGKEIDKVSGDETNGGATLIDYQGRLAAVLPIKGGDLICLTWQSEKGERLPEVLWGMYRVDASQTGTVPKASVSSELQVTAVDTGALTVGRNVFRIEGRQEEPQSLSIGLSVSAQGSGLVFEDRIETASHEFVCDLPYSIQGNIEEKLRFNYRIEEAATGRVLSSGALEKRVSPFESETREIEKTIEDLLALRNQLLERGTSAVQVDAARLELIDLREEIEGCLAERDLFAEEEALMVANRVRTTLPGARHTISKYNRILRLSRGAAIPKLMAWTTNPWWQIRSIEEELPPYVGSEAISLLLYRNEVEAGAINLLNLEDRPVSVRIKAPSRMAEDGPSVRFFEVISVPTEIEQYSDDALAALNQARTIHLAPGETRQVFVSVDAEAAAAGAYECEIVLSPISIQKQEIAIHLKAEVVDIDIESGTAPHLCTWGYVHGSLLKDYPKQVWEDRRDHGNNVINITSNFLPRAQYNEDGELTTELDFTALGEFVEARPGTLFLLLSYGGVLSGPKGVERFSDTHNKAFGAWLAQVVDFLKTKGIGYDDFALYPVDEPGLRPGLVDLYLNYARQARQADPKVLMYTDPVDGADMDDIQRMADYVDIWCPNRAGFLLKDEEPRLDVMKANAKMMWTYECQHQAKQRPPLEYYRGLAWLAELRGLTGFGFWSYCTSQDDPWGFPFLRSHDYLLVYPGEGVVTSRRWESVRDGIEDLRALAILKQLIAEKGNDPKAAEAVSEARAALEEAVAELGRFCLEPNGTGDLETVGVEWMTLERVDAEWDAYRKHRRNIAEKTQKLLSLQ